VLKVSELGLTENPLDAMIISVTGTFCGAPPDSVTAMAPVYTPAPNANGLTETLTPPGAANDPSVSQFPPLDAVAMKLDPEGPPEKNSDCAGGTGSPTLY
jgi:hypothetical protein